MNFEHVVNGHIYTTVLSLGSHAKALPEACFDSLVSHMSILPHPSISRGTVRLVVLGGAAVNTDRGTKTCVSIAVRYSRYFALVETHWKPETGEFGKQEARKWAKRTYELLAPFRSGIMTHAPDEINKPDVDGVNDIDNSCGCDDNIRTTPERMSTNESSATIPGSRKMAELDEVIKERLREVKKKYDPTNRFHNNANIQQTFHSSCSVTTEGSNALEVVSTPISDGDGAGDETQLKNAI